LREVCGGKGRKEEVERFDFCRSCSLLSSNWFVTLSTAKRKKGEGEEEGIALLGCARCLASCLSFTASGTNSQKKGGGREEGHLTCRLYIKLSASASYYRLWGGGEGRAPILRGERKKRGKKKRKEEGLPRYSHHPDRILLRVRSRGQHFRSSIPYRAEKKKEKKKKEKRSRGKKTAPDEGGVFLDPFEPIALSPRGRADRIPRKKRKEERKVQAKGKRDDILLAARHSLPAIYPYRYQASKLLVVFTALNTVDLMRRAAKEKGREAGKEGRK